jgi:hypothetical protein
MGNYGPNDVAQMAYFSFGKKAHKQLTQMITIIIIIISLNGLCFIRFSILFIGPHPTIATWLAKHISALFVGSRT